MANEKTRLQARHRIFGRENPERRRQDRRRHRAEKGDRQDLAHRPQKQLQMPAGRGRKHQGGELGEGRQAGTDLCERNPEPSNREHGQRQDSQREGELCDAPAAIFGTPTSL